MPLDAALDRQVPHQGGQLRRRQPVQHLDELSIATRAEVDRALLRDIVVGGRARERGTAELYRAYRRPLLAFFSRHGVDGDVAQDLLQEAFISLVRNAAGFRGEAMVATWLWSISRNRLLDHLRRTRPELRLDEDGWTRVADTQAAATGDPAAADAAASLDDCVRRGFEAFAKQFPQRAEALRRVALDGWSIGEVAAFLERSQGATREYLSQCRKKLKAFLEPCRGLLDETR